MEELLNILGDIEDGNEKVIDSFSSFMAVVLEHLNYVITADLVDCLVKLLDFEPFCSSKEKKKFGLSALYFASTVSMVKKLDPEGVTVMIGKTEGYKKLFLKAEHEKELFEMYGISDLFGR